MRSTPATSDPLRDLVQRFPAEGRVEAIIVRPDRGRPAAAVAEATAVPGFGLSGDRRSGAGRSGKGARKREVTLFQAEHLPVVARWCGLESIDAVRLRRNLVIRGVNLISMRSPFPDVRLEWQIGADVSIEVTGNCDPCSQMEKELGSGGYNALRGHGGMTALFLAGGVIRVGDPVRLKAVHRFSGEGPADR